MPFNEQTEPIEVKAAAPQTTTVTSATIDRQNYGRAQTHNWILSCGAASGTTPVLAISIQDSDDGSTDWQPVSGMTQFTNTTAAAFKQTTSIRSRRYLRAVQTITGTTPSFTYALIAIAGDPLDASI